MPSYNFHIDEQAREHESNLELFRSGNVAGQVAIRSSLLLNGGASVAMLAFIGHTAANLPERVPEFAECLFIFALAALSSSLIAGTTYLSQVTQVFNQSAGFWFNNLAIAFGLASYGLFFWGLLTAYNAFSDFSVAS